MQTYTITPADAAGREFSDWHQAPRWLRQLVATLPPGRALDMGAAWAATPCIWPSAALL
ncbi:MAG TPA: hypothetical protein VLI05_05405 [Candidatus Saccharimonadia bacterium]|nr:hypothetical protein [Candidatus Saccharimonadia bacterium]